MTNFELVKPTVTLACLIIDDPLLRPKYGCLDYTKLLQEMKEHNFFTEIAFTGFLQTAIGTIGPAPFRVGQKQVETVKTGVPIKQPGFQSQGHGRRQAHLEIVRTAMEF